MPARQGRPIFLIDIAVPRDVDPAVREVAGCTLVNNPMAWKKLRTTTCTSGKRRWKRRTTFLAEEIELFRARQEQLNVVPTIVCLKRRVEEIRQAEMKRMRRMFGALTP